MAGGRGDDVSRVTRWKRADFATDPKRLARALLGQRLVRILDDGARLAGIIVETEAYLGERDRAAHSFGGRRTARNESMYQRPGTAYVYFTYGMHFCMNVVCGSEGEPVAVLLRALMPVEGLDEMRRHRSGKRRRGAAPLRDTDLCSGPAKLCQALRIDRALDGEDLVASPRLFIERAAGEGGRADADGGVEIRRRDVARSARVGVSYAGEWAARPLRWFLSGNPHVSR